MHMTLPECFPAGPPVRRFNQAFVLYICLLGGGGARRRHGPRNPKPSAVRVWMNARGETHNSEECRPTSAVPTARVERVKLLAASCAHPFATAGFERFPFVPSFTPWLKTPIGEGAGEEGLWSCDRSPAFAEGRGILSRGDGGEGKPNRSPNVGAETSGSALLMLCRSVNAFCLYSLY